MRITKSQLQKIIREEKARLQAKKLHENDIMSLGAGGTTMQMALDEIRQSWYGIFSADDPSMEAVGLSGWHAQVDAAVDSLAEQFVNTFEEVDEALMNGDYIDYAG